MEATSLILKAAISLPLHPTKRNWQTRGQKSYQPLPEIHKGPFSRQGSCKALVDELFLFYYLQQPATISVAVLLHLTNKDLGLESLNTSFLASATMKHRVRP